MIKTYHSYIIQELPSFPFDFNSHCSMYRYFNMAPRLSRQPSMFSVVFSFVSKFLLGIERQKKLYKLTILTRKPRSRVRILIYRTWAISYPSQPLTDRLLNYRSPKNDNFIRMLWNNKIGFQVDHTISTMTIPNSFNRA